MDKSLIQPSRKILAEALSISEKLLDLVELSEGSLTSAMLKASRLARMLNDRDHQFAFEYEASGYPTSPSGVPADIFRLADIAGRVSEKKDKDDKVTRSANLQSIEVIEASIAAAKASLQTVDPSHIMNRSQLQNSIKADTKALANSRGFVHRYVARKYDELRFSGIAEDIFSRIRTEVDESISLAVPNSASKLTAIYDNLSSDNPEDWANAVHGCRRMLQDLADVLFPARAPATKEVRGNTIEIKLGPDNYINRLIAFVEERSDSGRFSAVVGSSLAFMGDRLDASFQAAQKGSHGTISTKEEADRYFVYTYMLVADLLSLR